MGHKYALAVVDDATAYKWYFVMKSLKEVGTIVKTLIKQLEKQLPYTVKRIRTDGGTEFVNNILNNYFKRNGFVYQQSNVESEEENGSAERAHQTIMGKVRYGGKMVAEGMTAVNNRIPTARLKEKCPYEVLFGTKPTGIGLQIWGSTCYAHIPKTKRTNQKLSERAIECKLLGLSDSYKGYRLLDIKENRHLIARDVKFGTTYTEGLISLSFPSGEINVNNENITEICDLGKRDREIDVSEPKKRPRVANEHENSVGSTETVGDVGQRVFVPPIPLIPRSCRKRRPNSRLRDYVVSINAVTISTKVISIPRSIKEARKGPHAQQWENALQIEYQALVANNT
ncbi:Integrase catalytic core protein [Phytophthora palmivora]|uniref:Integrase catalytic core protein n=1 Tax=Phytophthora palmivora TaxID=4796 RepID=A0A2P4XEE7_9STRA|nr:Integrase catalytic core protein [Phytophthora palmivora]